MEDSLLFTRLIFIQLEPFGPTVQSIGSYIASRGPQSISSLVQFFKNVYTAKRIKEALLVLLIQRFVVTTYPLAENMGPHLYYFNKRGCIEHLLYPILIELVQSTVEFSSETISIFLHVLTNGGSVFIESEPSTIKYHYDLLVGKGFLRCVSTETPIAPIPRDKKGQSAQNAKKLPIATQDAYSAIFSQLASDSSVVQGEIVAKKRKCTLSPILLVNWEFFYFHLQSQWLVDFFTTRIHQTAGLVMKIILDKIELADHVSYSSARVSLFEIIQALTNIDYPAIGVVSQVSSHEDYVPPINNISANISSLISLMISSSMGILFQDPTQIELSVGLNLDELKHVGTTLLYEKYIQDRFGESAFKVYRLLLVKQLLEEKQISKLAMMSLKEVRERLSLLYKNGLVLLQEIPRSLDFAPSRTIFLWKANTDPLVLTKKTLQVLVNLLERAKEEDKNSHPKNFELASYVAISIITEMAPFLSF